MSNIDKIRQEIERLVKMNKTKNGFPASFLCAVRIESYVKLLSFIDSLPDEPVSNDLEEAAETFCDTLEGKEAWSYGPAHYDWDDVNNAFIAGAEWMAKQKELPTNEKSERVIKAARSVLNNWLDGTDCPDVSGDFAELEYAIREYDGEEKQKEQKPAEWSEEDEEMLNSCISSIEESKENRYAYKENDGDTSYDREIAWLKSLRPSWKPSENQMSMLLAVVNDPNNAGSESCHLSLKSLYNDLKKL